MFAFRADADYGPISAQRQDKITTARDHRRVLGRRVLALSRHSRPPGRHRAHKPPSNKTPAVLASAVVGATAAALSTAAASGDGIQAMAASVTALQAPVPDTALGMGGPEPLPAGVAAEVPMNGRTVLAATAARGD